MSAKHQSIKDLTQKLVNHAELHALVTHLSALISAQDARLAECERVLAVDPEVGELAADFLKRIKGELGDPIRTLQLVADDAEVTAGMLSPGMIPDGGHVGDGYEESGS